MIYAIFAYFVYMFMMIVSGAAILFAIWHLLKCLVNTLFDISDCALK